jgi:preprotein translocase SecF subunit
MDVFVGTNVNFMGVRRIAFGISLALITMSIISIVAHGGLRLGVDFSGGILLQVKSQRMIPTHDIRTTLGEMGLGKAEIQQLGHEGEAIMRIPLEMATPTLADDIVDALNALHPDNKTEIRRQELVGPKVGAELRRTATLAVVFALVGMLIYIWLRFEFMFGLGGVVALAHDVTITLGFLSITNREITLQVIAALLTIVGYSINDTIVVYDRIRENMKIMHDGDLETIIDTSISQTISRTINTSLTVFLTVLPIYIFTDGTIKDFAFNMIIGLISGTYSSIYIAAPIVLSYRNAFAKRRKAKMESAFGRKAAEKTETENIVSESNGSSQSTTGDTGTSQAQTGFISTRFQKKKKK